MNLTVIIQCSYSYFCLSVCLNQSAQAYMSLFFRRHLCWLNSSHCNKLFHDRNIAAIIKFLFFQPVEFFFYSFHAQKKLFIFFLTKIKHKLHLSDKKRNFKRCLWENVPLISTSLLLAVLITTELVSMKKCSGEQ